MRTTVDLPAELMRAARIHAAERGETLKDLFARALSHELRARPGSSPASGRVQLPLVGVADARPVDVTNADIEAVLASEDAARSGRA